MSQTKTDINRIFQALGDPTRRAIIERLSKGPISVSQMAEPLEMTLAAVVQHVQVLQDSGLVATEKTGRVRTCRLEPGGLAAAANWLLERRTTWERQLDRLGDLLGEPDG